MKYNWNKYTLEDRLLTLYDLRSKTKNKDNLEEINYSISLLEDYIDNTFYDYPGDDTSLIEDLNQDTSFLAEYSFLRSELEYFDFIKTSFKDTPLELGKLSISKKKALEIINDFYRTTFDREIYINFLKNYHVRKNHLTMVNQETDAFTISIPYLNEAFIAVPKTNDIAFLYALVHEYMHATSFELNKYHLNYKSKRFVSEIDTLTSELLVSDYFEEKLQTIDPIIYQIILDITYHTYNKTLLDKMKIIDLHKKYDFVRNKELKNISQEKLGFHPLYTEEVVRMNASEYLPYIFGYMSAIELYSEYNDDKEKALWKEKKFIRLDFLDSENYYREMLNLGIHPNSHAREYQFELHDKALKLNK